MITATKTKLTRADSAQHLAQKEQPTANLENPFNQNDFVSPQTQVRMTTSPPISASYTEMARISAYNNEQIERLNALCFKEQMKRITASLDELDIASH